MNSPKIKTFYQLCFLAIFSMTLIACSTNEPFKETGVFIDDSVITTRVKAKLAASKEVSALNVAVETSQGVVQLSGFVNSEAERKAAINVTKQVPGVKAIQDKMSIKPAAEG